MWGPRMAEFLYATYGSFKDYRAPALSRKDVRRLDREVWKPAGFRPDMAVLELGCGTGGFLLYLRAKGVERFVGVDHDANLAAVMPRDVADRFVCGDVGDFLQANPGTAYDRIVMLDVLEHFPPDGIVALLRDMRGALAPSGRIVVRVPNMASPWGLTYQHGDLTHRTALTDAGLRQLGDAAGYAVEKVYDQRRGGRRRMITDRLVHGFLSWALLAPPPLWGPNLYAVLAPRG